MRRAPVRDLVVVSLEEWDAVWRRNQHLVSRLLRDDPDLRVLFVEPPADPVHAARRRTRPQRGAGLRLGPDLTSVPSGRLYLFQATKALPRRVDTRADVRLAEQVVEAADRLARSVRRHRRLAPRRPHGCRARSSYR